MNRSTVSLADRETGAVNPMEREVAVVIMLAGGTGASVFAASCGRSVLELPVTPGSDLLSLWKAELRRAVQHHAASTPTHVRVLGVTPGTPVRTDPEGLLDLSYERDPSELRGTGGLLRDLAGAYSDETLMLVVSASTVLLEPLEELIGQLRGVEADVALLRHLDGSSPNLMMIRAGCLRSIPPVGFVDFKEQALPAIMRAGEVRVVNVDHPVAATARNLEEYIKAVRLYHQNLKGVVGVSRTARQIDPFAESWQPAFGFAEPGATVGPGARLLDAVALRGSKVGDGAVVVRSVVGPGGVVPAGAQVIDRMICGPVGRHINR
jgi:hypothetical protein